MDRREPRDFNSRQCYTCHEVGHIAKYCPKQGQNTRMGDRDRYDDRRNRRPIVCYNC